MKTKSNHTTEKVGLGGMKMSEDKQSSNILVSDNKMTVFFGVTLGNSPNTKSTIDFYVSFCL